MQSDPKFNTFKNKQVEITVIQELQEIRSNLESFIDNIDEPEYYTYFPTIARQTTDELLGAVQQRLTGLSTESSLDLYLKSKMQQESNHAQFASSDFIEISIGEGDQSASYRDISLFTKPLPREPASLGSFGKTLPLNNELASRKTWIVDLEKQKYPLPSNVDLDKRSCTLPIKRKGIVDFVKTFI